MSIRASPAPPPTPTDYIRIRPGTDIPLIWGLLWHVFENGWEDKEFIRQRVYGMDEIRAEVAKWNPEECERVTGVPGEQLRKAAETMAKNKPSTLIWCMGATQKTVGTANVRAFSIFQLALGNIGVEGGGANIYRGHSNVQGATDMGLDVTSLPSYYGLAEGAWRHWARVWEVDYDWLKGRFASKELMETKGVPTTRWFDAVLAKPGELDQPNNIKAFVTFGPRRQHVTRMPEMRRGLEALELMVVVDPHPDHLRVGQRTQERHLYPAGLHPVRDCPAAAPRPTGRFNGPTRWSSRSSSPRRLRDHVSAGPQAGLRGSALQEHHGRWHQAARRGHPAGDQPGSLSTGYTGQSPERLKMHMEYQADFDKISMRATKGPCKGEYYGLPWPCWGTPEMKHPGSAVLYDTSKHVMEGGSTFRARFGIERNGVSLLADGSYSKGSEITDGYPEFTMAVLKKLGWDADLTPDEMAVINKIGGDNVDQVSWMTDLSFGIIRVALKHGCVPHGNAKARAVAWNLPDPVPIHREPLYTPRRDLVEKYPAMDDRRDFRMTQLGKSVPGARRVEGVPDHPHLRPSGRVRGRRRGNPVQPMAGRVAAGNVRRGQHQGRRAVRGQAPVQSLGLWAGIQQQGQGDGVGHRPRGAGCGIHAVPLLGPLGRRGPALQVPAWNRPDRAWAPGQRRHDLWLRPRDSSCRKPK